MRVPVPPPVPLIGVPGKRHTHPSPDLRSLLSHPEDFPVSRTRSHNRIEGRLGSGTKGPELARLPEFEALLTTSRMTAMNRMIVHASQLGAIGAIAA